VCQDSVHPLLYFVHMPAIPLKRCSSASRERGSPSLEKPEIANIFLSVVDPDAYVFGPPRSGSVSQRYGSGSGSFYHQAKTHNTEISEKQVIFQKINQ
jgi:hypothetical protein